MIDARTVGIDLALSDGVAEGLEIIRRELAAFSGVLDENATHLDGLIRVAANLKLQPSALSSDPERAVHLDCPEDGKPKSVIEMSPRVQPERADLIQSGSGKAPTPIGDGLAAPESQTNIDRSGMETNRWPRQSAVGTPVLPIAPISRSPARDPVHHATIGLLSCTTQEHPASSHQLSADRTSSEISGNPTMASIGTSIPMGVEGFSPPSAAARTPASLPGGQPQGFSSSWWPSSTSAGSSSAPHASSRDATIETSPSDAGQYRRRLLPLQLKLGRPHSVETFLLMDLNSDGG